MDAFSDFDRQHLENLKSEIQEDLITLSDIDRQQAVEKDPLEKRRLRQYDQRTRESYYNHREEYANLLRKEIPTRFTSGEQDLIYIVVQRLDSDQLDLTHIVLQAADRDPNDPALTQLFAEVASILPSVQHQLETKGMAVASHVAQVARVIQAPTADLKQKLKLSIPLIPFFLSLETEFNLNITANLKAAWEKLTQRFRPT